MQFCYLYHLEATLISNLEFEIWNWVAIRTLNLKRQTQIIQK